MSDKSAEASSSDPGKKARDPQRSDEESARDPLEIALTDFTEAQRQGLNPSNEEFAKRYPALADQIRELFPLVDNLERWKTDKEVECLRRNVPREFSFDRLGEYQLARELGRGGMGVVFEAVHSVSGRHVAIKLLPWRYAADMPVWKERLQREASTIAALKHPNIVQIYSFSEDQGYYYYVMQLIDGESLDHVISRLKRDRNRRRPSKATLRPVDSKDPVLSFDSWKGFARLGNQVAQALACAHKRGILHNDIKPSNLLVRSNGQVIVTDFGIGRLPDSELSEGDDHSVGTLRYMAPERWGGTTDQRGDVYSLGATLYELATQTPLFDVRKRSELIDAIQKQQPIMPRRLVADVPVPLERIILKSLARDPNDRYATAIEMADDLRRFINRQPIQATERGLFHKATSWLRGWTRKQS